MKKRYISLDVLRGLTVAMMIVVNNPGSWTNVFPFLRHAPWEGCTPCDLVFPFFLFCVGTSMAFALAKYASLSWDALKKILKRGLLLFLVGVALNAFPFYPSASNMDPGLTFWQNWLEWAGNLRLMGVLQRIAMCYVFGSVLALWLRNTSRIWCGIGVLSLLHVGLLLIFAGPEGAFTLEGNFAGKVDRALLGESHMYGGYTDAAGVSVPFDPEGLFGVLTGTCTVLVGYLAGCLIRNSAEKYSESSDVTYSPTGVSVKLYTYAALSLLGGLALGIFIPISKPLWSVSYVFYAGGWSMLVLAFLVYMIDVRGMEKPFFPFKALGMNALAIYVLSGLLMKLNWRYLQWDYTVVFGGDEYMSLLFALLYLLLHLVVAVFLYKKRIFIKL